MKPETKKYQMEIALRKAGCRLTSQRVAIVNYLSSTSAHPDAARIFQEVKKVQPGLSLATVYNTLQVLLANDLISILALKDENRYETNLSFHINLVCVSCGKIEDFPTESLMMPEVIYEQSGFEVKTYRMEYHGLCLECQKKGEKK